LNARDAKAGNLRITDVCDTLLPCNRAVIFVMPYYPLDNVKQISHNGEKYVEVKNMARTAMINARTERELKKEVEGILQSLGLSTTEAINIFFRQVKLRRGLPFPVEIPNDETLKVFRDSEAGHGSVACKDADDMFNRLGI
jgi:DNA-damage-inducible protein J